MISSAPRIREAFAQDVRVSDELLTVELVDGRSVSVPISWYPRLAHGTPEERRNWRLIGRGEGIHWTDLDEDIRVEALLGGLRSAESQASFDRWLKERKPAS